MNYIELFLTLIAVVIACWALNLQRREIIKNGKINSLIHMSSLIQDRIDFHRRIIDDIKHYNETIGDEKKQKVFGGHSHKVNKELRPLKHKVDSELFDLIEKYEGISNINEVRKVTNNITNH